MGAWFQTYVNGGFLQEIFVFDGTYGVYFGMRLSATDVVSFSDDGVVVHNDSAYHRVGGCVAEPVVCQLQAAGNIFFIFCHNDLV